MLQPVRAIAEQTNDIKETGHNLLRSVVIKEMYFMVKQLKELVKGPAITQSGQIQCTSSFVSFS